MSICRLYPVCPQEKSGVIEFLSGFFYLGRNKYVKLPSNTGELQLRLDRNKSICLRNTLKILLYMTGIAFLIAGIYKLVERASLAGKKISIITNQTQEKRTKDVAKEKLEKPKITIAPVIQPIKKTIKSIEVKIERLDLVNLAQPMERPELEKWLSQVNDPKVIYINRNAALKEYFWMADLLSKHPDVKIEFQDNQEHLHLVLEKDSIKAMGIYATKSRPFAEFVFSSCAEAFRENAKVREIADCFLDVVMIWSQSTEIASDALTSPQFVDDLIFALSLVEEKNVKDHQEAFERLLGFLLSKGSPEQLLLLSELCRKNSLLSKNFLEKISSEQLEEMRDHFQIPETALEEFKDEKNKAAFFLKKICLLLQASEICSNKNSWDEQKKILEKLWAALPNFSKQDIRSLLNFSTREGDYYIFSRFGTIDPILFALSVLQVQKILLSDAITVKTKITACRQGMNFMSWFGGQTDYVSFGKFLAALDLSGEASVEIILKVLDTRGIRAFLEAVLKNNDDEKIETVFKWYLPHRQELEQRAFTTWALLLECIDTPQKAAAIYKAYPDNEIKKNLLEGIKCGNTLFKPKISQEEISKILNN